jgi:hypothetical protein
VKVTQFKVKEKFGLWALGLYATVVLAFTPIFHWPRHLAICERISVQSSSLSAFAFQLGFA